MITKYHRLELLHKIIETGSISETSRQLKAAQPNVSRALADFEQKIGFKLFSRKGNKIIPTKEALLLYRETQGFMTRIDSMEKLITQLAKGFDNYLKLAMTPLASFALWNKFYPKFVDLSSNFILDSEVVSENKILRSLYNFDMDMIVTSKITKSQEVKSVKLATSQIVLLTSKQGGFEQTSINQLNLENQKIFKNHHSESLNQIISNEVEIEIDYYSHPINCRDQSQLIEQVIAEGGAIFTEESSAIRLTQSYPDSLWLYSLDPKIDFNFYVNYLASNKDENEIERFVHLLLAT